MIVALATAQLWVLGVAGVLLGAAVGSFGCVVIERLPRRLDEPNEFGDLHDTNPWGEVLGGESRCSSCGADIRWIDKIPVASWLALRGKCRGCGDRIPRFHPVVEFLVPAVGVAVVAAFGWEWRILPLLWLVPVGIIVSAIDLRTLMVPTRIVWPSLFVSVALGVAAAAVEGEWNWVRGGVLGAAMLSVPLAVLWFAMPGGMGFGDVRLSVLLGWTLGFSVIEERWGTVLFLAACTLAVAAVLGIVSGIGGMITQGRKAKVPFGPPFIVAALAVSAFGNAVLKGFEMI